MSWQLDYPGCLDAIESLVTTPGWDLVSERIRSVLQKQIGTPAAPGELEKTADAINAAELRGYVRGLRLALNIPTILIDEFNGKVKERT